jgi:hypothetical protein
MKVRDYDRTDADETGLVELVIPAEHAVQGGLDGVLGIAGGQDVADLDLSE